MTPKIVAELETPSVLIDLDVMENNIHRMQEYCNTVGKNFRAHIKTHKIPAIARLQVDAGAVGIACQKVSEAEVFADAGFENIQIPYNIMGESKLNRLMILAEGRNISVAADHMDVVSGLQVAAYRHGITLHVMPDLGTTIQRTGASPAYVVQLAQQIADSSNLNLAGLLVYPSTAENRGTIQETLAALDKADLPVTTVSGGGMEGYLQASDVPEVTELRVGTYVFNDWKTMGMGWCKVDDCAMTVLATVVSHPTHDRVILDSGSKTLSSDIFQNGYGYIVEYPEAHIYKLNEEHAHCDFSKCAGRPKVGEQVHVIPAHTCVVTNLHNLLYGVRGEHIEVIWPVAARGLVW